MGSEATAASGGVKGAERVAAVDSRGRRPVADDDVGYRNRPHLPVYYNLITPAGVMELVDVVDSKSTAGDSVPVRVRSPAPKKQIPRWGICFFAAVTDSNNLNAIVRRTIAGDG